MKTQTKKFVKQKGAALILVVVVTVLLAVIGTMFLMVSRLSEMETVAAADERDLTGGVETVVSRINEVLVNDLFGADGVMVNANSANFDADESYDYPTHNVDPGPDGKTGSVDDTPYTAGVLLPGNLDDYWLASLEPVFDPRGPDGILGNADDNGPDGIGGTGDDAYIWLHITDLWGTLQVRPDSLLNQSFYPIPVRWFDPDSVVDGSQWSYTFTAWDNFRVSAFNVRAKIIAPKDRMKVILGGATGTTAIPDPWDDKTKTTMYGARADADGDGVADSRWVKVPGLTTSRGKDVFAAVRIIDNCAMLNLNVANCFDVRSYSDANKTSPFRETWNYYPTTIVALQPWHSNQGSGTGRYLTEINYLPFLRGKDLNGNLFAGTSGGDFWYNLMIAKGLFWKPIGAGRYPVAPKASHAVLMDIENPGNAYQLFGIDDELELRNRYLLTSKVESRFEQKDIANFSLDSGSTDYAALQVPRDTANPISIWCERIAPVNFDKWDMAGNLAVGTVPFKYDRRHVCTFYSFDRNLRKGQYPRLDSEIETYAMINWSTSGYSSWAAYKEYLWGLWGPIFTPKGAVTTNIEDPSLVGQFNSYNSMETRKRIVHLLYAFRDYYYQQNGGNLNAAALSAAQVVANLIDFSDNDALNTLPIRGATEGPFYETVYGAQANGDCTFITKAIVDQMRSEICTALGVPAVPFNFGLNATDVIFGYERQPFISEVYAKWNGLLGQNAAIEAFAIEMINPYSTIIDLENWAIKIGKTTVVPFNSNAAWDVPGASVAGVPARAVYHGTGAVSIPGGIIPTLAITQLDTMDTLYFNPAETVEIRLLRPAPQWVKTNLGINYVAVDKVSDLEVRTILNADGQNALKRDDNRWKYASAKYQTQRTVDGNFSYTIGQSNGVSVSGIEGFQLAAADDQNPLCRWHELETLSLYGNGSDGSSDPNTVLTTRLAASATSPKHFDLAGASGGLLDYLCTMNRPDKGSLPGRININTAPVHVIAAAIPPKLADDNVGTAMPVTFSALQLAQAIVDYRQKNGPYQKLGDLLTIWADLNSNTTEDANEKVFQRYYTNGFSSTVNTGQQSIQDDIEERDWILSNLANKFTVRSDTFTAYILVRLGEDGPQRRMIAIFDRSHVWKPTDRPKLVALHPVPDSR